MKKWWWSFDDSHYPGLPQSLPSNVTLTVIHTVLLQRGIINNARSLRYYYFRYTWCLSLGLTMQHILLKMQSINMGYGIKFNVCNSRELTAGTSKPQIRICLCTHPSSSKSSIVGRNLTSFCSMDLDILSSSGEYKDLLIAGYFPCTIRRSSAPWLLAWKGRLLVTIS